MVEAAPFATWGAAAHASVPVKYPFDKSSPLRGPDNHFGVTE